MLLPTAGSPPWPVTVLLAAGRCTTARRRQAGSSAERRAVARWAHSAAVPIAFTYNWICMMSAWQLRTAKVGLTEQFRDGHWA